MRRGLVALGAVLAAALAAAAPASASSFSGSCSFSGPLTVGRPITIVPVAGAHFSFRGTGSCTSAGGTQPLTLTFTNVSTIFDTCELGPDLPLDGILTIGGARFDVVVDLVRVALVGPFTLTTAGGGLAAGVGQFAPADTAAALTQCVSPGIVDPSLSGSFSTLTPLVGT
jgi:hypothetical protein